jgi:phosphate acetyltransferase
MARDLMEDVSYFGTMMVYKGDADGMVSGATYDSNIPFYLLYNSSKLSQILVLSLLYFSCV